MGEGSRILFDGRRCSIPGAALAGGMLIDSVDAHDGYKPVKGHVGCGVLPAVLAFSEAEPDVSEAELMSRIVMGYEIGARAGTALHATASDYHTSGAWIALATAAIGSRSLRATAEQTREALGIAEYHGPRSQMMRCIDHPTMVKDGSGWGSMAGCSAALLACDGFTGAPALTIEADDVKDVWADLGSRWTILEQYVKAYPVCRWAQPAIAGVIALQGQHDFTHSQITALKIGTFHESKRLQVRQPMTTEQAQYSLPFPTAAAAVHGEVTPAHIDGAGLQDKQVLRISNLIELEEIEEYNHCFPELRKSHVVIELDDGRSLESGTIEAAGDPENPFSVDEIKDKFMRLASPALTEFGAQALVDAVMACGDGITLRSLNSLIYKSEKVW